MVKGQSMMPGAAGKKADEKADRKAVGKTGEKTAAAPVRASDRIVHVLERSEGMLEFLSGLAPAFKRLRNPAMRKIMGRLATVEHAARIAGLEPDWLVDQLNEELAQPTDPIGGGEVMERRTEGDGDQATPSVTTTDGEGMPHALAQIPDDLVHDLDVRPALRRGEEPFKQIMTAKNELPEGGVLRLRAIFEPVPLYAVMSKQGYEHWTEEFADDDWRVWFYPKASKGVAKGAAPEGEAEDRAGEGTPEDGAAEVAEEFADDPNVVILDVRGLEPPEPMVRTLEALEELPPDGTLIQLNVRVPQFLLPQLEARGFTYEVRPQDDVLTRVFIRRAPGAAS